MNNLSSAPSPSPAPQCPQCGAKLPENAPAGLCPRCLMELNFKTETLFTDDAPGAQPPLPPLPAEQIAPHFPQLEILECLGRGGMGVVYKARQKSLNRFVALKLLAPERVGDAKFAGRFTREAQALAALNHPNIVTIYDFGQAGGFYFLLMEFLDGLNLRQLLRTRKFTPEEALAIVPALCDALQFAHERGIVHRDIKPENLLLDKTGRVKVADFGIAKMLGEVKPGEKIGGKAGDPAAPESATHEAMGTPRYSAPEQKYDPQRVDSRADIYSLGVVFYELLTGELPGQRMEPPSKKVQIDVRLDAVVMRALEKTPELRWQTAAELRTQVETITGSAEEPPGGPHQAPILKGMSLRIMGWGLGLAVGGMEISRHVSSPVFSYGMGVWTVLIFLIATSLALFGRNDLEKLKFACRLVLLDGLVMASACIWGTFVAHPPLITAWRDAIVAACLIGIAYCVHCWFKLRKLNLTTVEVAVPWTTAKTFGIIAAIVLLTAGTTVFLVNYNVISPNDESSWALDTGSLNQLPPMVALRPSRDNNFAGIVGIGNKMLARGVSLGTLMGYAYGQPQTYIHWSENRVILPPDVRDDKFDFRLTVPDHSLPRLQAEIIKQLGLAAHRELRETDALVLVVSNPGAPGLAAVPGGNSSDTGASPGRSTFAFTNMPIDDVSDFLEVSLGKPVINETELTQKYQGSIKWNHQSDPAAELKEVQNVLSEQLGLELVPRREPVEMLVVEKVR